MDLTSLDEHIDFPETFRGYDPEAVDRHLAEVNATVEQLTTGERDARERAERAEAELATLRTTMTAASAGSADGSHSEEMSEEREVELASRMLLMAKRAADAALADAEDEASTRVTDARDHAAQLVSDAQAETDRLVQESRDTIERELREGQARFAEEIEAHEQQKDALGADIVALEERLVEYRADLEHVYGSLRTIIDDPEALRPKAPLDIEFAPAAAADPEPQPFRSLHEFEQTLGDGSDRPEDAPMWFVEGEIDDSHVGDDRGSDERVNGERVSEQF